MKDSSVSKDVSNILFLRALQVNRLTLIPIPEDEILRLLKIICPDLLKAVRDTKVDTADYPDYYNWLIYSCGWIPYAGEGVMVFYNTSYSVIKTGYKLHNTKTMTKLRDELGLTKWLGLVCTPQCVHEANFLTAVQNTVLASDKCSYYDVTGYEYTEEDLEIEQEF
jgi:hypothetical protein